MADTPSRNFRQLRVWKAAHDLVLKVYNNTRTFPQEEKFSLVVQMRRAAASVPLNIAEGFARKTRKDKTRFYNIAQASLEELRYALILARDLEYLDEYVRLEELAESVAKMLAALIRAVEAKIGK